MKKEKLSVYDRLEKVDKLVRGNHLSKKELENIQILADEHKKVLKEKEKLVKKVERLERSSSTYEELSKETEEREERDYLLNYDE